MCWPWLGVACSTSSDEQRRAATSHRMPTQTRANLSRTSCHTPIPPRGRGERRRSDYKECRGTVLFLPTLFRNNQERVQSDSEAVALPEEEAVLCVKINSKYGVQFFLACFCVRVNQIKRLSIMLSLATRIVYLFMSKGSRVNSSNFLCTMKFCSLIKL